MIKQSLCIDDVKLHCKDGVTVSTFKEWLANP
jgi:hypothetical protein